MAFLTTAAGGRHTPIFDNYRPSLLFDGAETTGTITLPIGTEMVMPGETTGVRIHLTQPVALAVGAPFAVLEGTRTVAGGSVTKIIG